MSVTINSGYNWIFYSNYLLGLEAEVSNGKKITHQYDPINWGSEWRADINYIANLRLKIGRIYENQTLYYVTAGPAMSDLRYHAKYIIDDPYPISIQKTNFGLSYGLGIENKIYNNSSLKLEYMLTTLNSASRPYPNPDGIGCFYDSCEGPSFKTKTSSIRIGYNYYF